MPLKVTFTAADIEKLSSRLAGVERGLAKQALKEPLLHAAKPWVGRWKELAPKPGSQGYTGPGRGRKAGKGGLADAIGAKVVPGRDTYVLLLIVGAEYSTAPHEHLVERGHAIVRRGRSARTGEAIKTSGGKVRGGWYGRKAGRQTESERGQILLAEVGRWLDEHLKA